MGENSVSMTKKSSKLSRRAVAVATIGLIGGGSLLLGGAPAQAADTTATVTGDCLTVLACGNVKFNASQFAVPSGGQLVVANGIHGLLSPSVVVTIGNQSKTIATGKTATFTFGQSYDQQSFPMSATGALLNSAASSQVKIAPAAKPSPPEPSTSVPPSSSPGTGGGTGGSTGGGSSHGGVQAPALPQGTPNQGQPPALLPPGLNVPNNPAAKPPVTQPGLPNGADGGTPQNTTGAAPAGAAPSDPTAAGGASNDSPGPLTLLVLVAAVVVAGVGSAAVRTVLGARGRFARAATH
jgi:hypothetical protein